MRWTVFSSTDAVVGGDVDLLQPLKSSHADCGGGIEIEHEERAGDREECSLVESSEAVGNGTHGMLADAVVEVAAAVVAVEITSSSQIGLRDVSIQPSTSALS